MATQETAHEQQLRRAVRDMLNAVDTAHEAMQQASAAREEVVRLGQKSASSSRHPEARQK